MRLFVAIDPPLEIRAKLSAAISRRTAESRVLRWVRPEGMHLTLKFIGEADANRLDAIRQALRTTTTSSAIALRFRGIGFFCSLERPRVAWCGVEAGDELAALALKISAALKLVGVPEEPRAFTPHVTLARLPSGLHMGNLVRAAQALKSYDFGAMDATEFHLYQSFLKPSGAEYKRIETFRFLKGSL